MVAGQSPAIGFTAVIDQTRHKKGRRAKPRNWFYMIICGRFESKWLYVAFVAGLKVSRCKFQASSYLNTKFTLP